MKGLLLAALAAVSSLPVLAQSTTPSMEIVGASSFRAPPGHLLAEPLRVRVRDAQGQPWAGITVEFGVRIGGLYFGGQTPPYGKYGLFVTGELPSSAERHFVVTGADGIASSLPYRVAYDSEGAWAQAISGFPGNAALGTHSLRADFDVVRGSVGEPVALPVGSVPVLLVLIAGLFGLARRRLAALASR